MSSSESASEYTQLSNCQNFRNSKILETLASLRLNFPINELTQNQWSLLESLADETKNFPLNQIVTWRFSERIENCAENGVNLLVTRYIEIDPIKREILPKKTVRVLPTLYSVEMYLKNYEAVYKF